MSVPDQLTFVDIHCHMLPGLDDGADSWEESLAMARLSVADGFSTVITTPHQLGNYGEAIIYLFSYQLVRLDRSQLIRLAKGKTNRQYLGELQSASPLKRMLAQSMSSFEDVFFWQPWVKS